MRPRKVIEADGKKTGLSIKDALILEALLDIRELSKLTRQRNKRKTEKTK